MFGFLLLSLLRFIAFQLLSVFILLMFFLCIFRCGLLKFHLTFLHSLRRFSDARLRLLIDATGLTDLWLLLFWWWLFSNGRRRRFGASVHRHQLLGNRRCAAATIPCIWIDFNIKSTEKVDFDAFKSWSFSKIFFLQIIIDEIFGV